LRTHIFISKIKYGILLFQGRESKSGDGRGRCIPEQGVAARVFFVGRRELRPVGGRRFCGRLAHLQQPAAAESAHCSGGAEREHFVVPQLDIRAPKRALVVEQELDVVAYQNGPVKAQHDQKYQKLL